MAAPPHEPTNHPGGGSIGTAVLGAGPAGLTGAYVLAGRGATGRVFEAGDTVGGISRTVEVAGYRFDLGGHRFFTKIAPVARLWEEMLGDDFLERPRLSRIYYGGRFLAYPLQARDVLDRLGVAESARCAVSYFAALARGTGRDAETFEEWVTARFGRRLYETFFRSYTEKVWGIPGSEIRAEWAAQRIKDFSLANAILSVLRLRRSTSTTLIERFRYPRRGPGQMWQAFQAHVVRAGIEVELGTRVLEVRHHAGRAHSVLVAGPGGPAEHAVDAVLSSIPLGELVARMCPSAPEAVLAAAGGLRYRSMCLVALMTDEPEPFPDNWIYLHDPGVRAGRVQNFGAWSPDMVPEGRTCLGVEYFCFEEDDVWTMDERDAVALATRELAAVGLIDPSRVTGGVRVRVPKSYPMYDARYAAHVGTIREYLAGFANVQTCGRNGLHRYNNQDHSMWTGALAALNLIDGAAHDIWSVNTEASYHEAGEAVEAALELPPLSPEGALAAAGA